MNLANASLSCHLFAFVFCVQSAHSKAKKKKKLASKGLYVDYEIGCCAQA